MRFILTALALVLLSCGAQAAGPGGFASPATHPIAGYPPVAPPSQASGVGYNTLTWTTGMAASDIDTGLTYSPGFKLYCNNFVAFGGTGSPQACPTLTRNSDASVNIQRGPVSGDSGTVTSAAWVPPYGSVGTAFGGGMYIEARILQVGPPNIVTSWGAFWGMSLEHLAFSDNDTGEHWAGQPAGYSHFVENDFMEYLDSSSVNNYAATMHDWYGIFNSTCAGQNYCNQQNANFVHTASSLQQAYHTYGMLWVPATVSTSGYVQYYFDNNPVGSPTTWTQYVATSTSPPPTGQPWEYGIEDTQHLVVILNGGPATYMQVQWVNVWQLNSSGNWVNH